MYRGFIGVAPEGIPFILLLALATIVFAAFGWKTVALLFLAMTFFTGHFFRDPERIVPQDPGAAVSPADGKIVKVEPRSNPLTGEHQVCISIFMNVFNVHVNRAPVEGTIRRIVYFPGKFFNASLDKASTDNERCSYMLEDANGSMWTMTQIAGLIARRIVCRVEEGSKLQRGGRFGMIRFGSRVDLYLPQDYTSCIAIGQKVFAGETVIARRK